MTSFLLSNGQIFNKKFQQLLKIQIPKLSNFHQKASHLSKTQKAHQNTKLFLTSAKTRFNFQNIILSLFL